jgi:hypothetical protein
MSEKSDSEVILEVDSEDTSATNTELFEDVQEWSLSDEVQVATRSLPIARPMDAAKCRMHSFLWCRTQATRRPGYYIFTIFLMAV